jgi:hypothetical protein
MNNFQRIIPRKKSNKKRASSSKRSNSLTEGNNPKKINNSERFFTTYDEVFEKLNSKIYKSGKVKANSASKNRKNSLIKHKKKKSIERKNLRNIWTNNTNCTTQDTDNNKVKYIKNSPRKEEFSKILDKAKDLLSIQSDLVLQCGKLSQNLSKSDLDINSKMKNEINDNGSNTLPGLAKALYLLECKRDNRPINYGKKYNYNKNIEEIENSFYIKILNELNGFIGELGYDYVYNEFDEFNYKKENILIFFSNIQKLLNFLHQTINEQKDMLIKQSNQIKEYERYIQEIQYNNNNNNLSNSLNENKNILINENQNESQNNINTNSAFFNNTSSQEFDKLKDCNNVFKNNTHYFNSYMNNNENYNNQNNENFNNIKESQSNSSEFDKQNLPPEMSNNYLNYYNNQNQNIISSMINSASFFESYKRNKDLKNNLNYNYNILKSVSIKNRFKLKFNNKKLFILFII